MVTTVFVVGKRLPALTSSLEPFNLSLFQFKDMTIYY
jgi:hypothetical protein